MAFNVLIVDDEYMVRDGLTKYVPWEEYGFHVAGTAENGIDGLNMIRRLRPDLLLTDVRMPFLNGIDLIERALKVNPNMYIVVFSGHDEFEYVQKAVNNGASGYLLKPLDINAFRPMLENIREDLLNQQQMDSMITDLTANSMKLLDAKKEQVLRNLMFDILPDEDDSLEELGIYRDDCCMVGILKAEDGELTEAEKKAVCKNMRKCAEDAGRRDYLTVMSGDAPNNLIYVIFGLEEMIGRTAENYRVTLKKMLTEAGIRAADFCSEVYRSVYSLSEAYGEAKALSCYGDTLHGEESMYYEFEEITASVLLDREEIDAYTERLIQWVRENNIGLKLFDTFYVSNFYLQIQKRARDMETELGELIGSPARFHKAICAGAKMENRLEALRELLLKISDHLNANKNTKTVSAIEKAKQYIGENYADRELSLQSVAAYCAITPNYLSNIFKQHTDMNFSEYLSQVRIKKAEELLLLTDKTVYEIAEQVGYDNSAYFCTVFKKTVGQTPSFYRSKNRDK